jgi:predicted transcriptional regulator of viral defense system
MQKNRYDDILKLIQDKGMLRARDLDVHDIPRQYLRRMVANGVIERVGYGLYALPNMEITEHHTLALASRRFPHAVVCLLSALQFHGLTTQLPHRVWMAISPKDRLPQPNDVPIRFVRFSGAALSEGVEKHEIEKVPVSIYRPTKTVADCFKYRKKIGIDVAIEALRDCLAATDEDGRRLYSVDEIWHYAQVCRVANVMQPYLEVLI